MLVCTLYALGFLTLRGGDLLEENGYITTVPEWREVVLLLVDLLCMDEREPERKIHAREHVEDMSV